MNRQRIGSEPAHYDTNSPAHSPAPTALLADSAASHSAAHSAASHNAAQSAAAHSAAAHSAAAHSAAAHSAAPQPCQPFSQSTHPARRREGLCPLAPPRCMPHRIHLLLA